VTHGLFNGLFFRDNMGSPITSTRKVKKIWILMKQDMMGCQWHLLDHMQIICTSL